MIIYLINISIDDKLGDIFPIHISLNGVVRLWSNQISAIDSMD